MHCSDKQSQLDLNLDIILEWSAEYALQPTAKKKLVQLSPSNRFAEIDEALQKVNEWKELRVAGDAIPALEFEELHQEIKLLGIQDAIISREGFWRILLASQTINAFLLFIEKRSERSPRLTMVLDKVYYTYELINELNNVFDKDGSIKDNASDELFQIRLKIKQLRAQINRNFEKEMRKLIKDKLLGETYETFVNNRRVLLVQSAYKRKVSGAIHGTSKTGNLSYIEPYQNVALNNELDHLIDDEQKEILRILKRLTRFISSYKPLIIAYNQTLISLDFIQAKARLALEMQASLPLINKSPRMNLVEAFHPLLRRTNSNLGKLTIPQHIFLNEKQKMVVISGPNAGGKSLTLKTVGLLQMMLQCGFLVPLDPRSEMCYFQQILSDIGDNQSIDNELSTYSYRLKRMKYFLKVSNSRTLLLLDEFGSGSDPELGGVLAEVFLEELYSKKSFAVITTHYSTIKTKAEQLKFAINGCMLFDMETLSPLYKLEIGQPGSSFTFEVAILNGFENELINRAKSKLDPNKIKMDALLHDIQKEKNYLERLIKEHEIAQKEAYASKEYHEEKSSKLNAKLSSQNQLVEQYNKEIQAGKKMLSFIDRFNVKSRKKNSNENLYAEMKNYLTLEKSKKSIKETTSKNLDSSVKKKTIAAQEKKSLDFEQNKIKTGSLVQLISSNRNGTVESIKGNKVTVIFGNARMKVSLENLKFLS
ncbi:MAG: endonuclease MutS2 [Crocinitomicaceae bacterium]